MAWGDTREVILAMPRMPLCFFKGRPRVVRVSGRTSAGITGTGGQTSVFLVGTKQQILGLE